MAGKRLDDLFEKWRIHSLQPELDDQLKNQVASNTLANMFVWYGFGLNRQFRSHKITIDGEAREEITNARYKSWTGLL